jgi:hypothetical protein
MQNAAQYRVYAKECRELAKKAKGENKEKLLKIAEAWEQCAADVDILNFPKSPHVDRFDRV